MTAGALSRYIMGNKDLNTAVNNNYRNVQSETHIKLFSIIKGDIISILALILPTIKTTKYRHVATRTIYLTILQFSWAEH